MTAPGNGLLIFLLTLAIIVSSGYAIGRIHQWHRHGLERDEAYRIGYDRASRSIVGMMSDAGPINPAPDATRQAPRRSPNDNRNSRRIVVNQRQLYPVHHDEADHAHI